MPLACHAVGQGSIPAKIIFLCQPNIISMSGLKQRKTLGAEKSVINTSNLELKICFILLSKFNELFCARVHCTVVQNVQLLVLYSFGKLCSRAKI